MPDAAQPAESAPAELSFSEFVADKHAQPSDASVETHPSTEEKVAPASEPVKDPQETKGLSDDEKADRKKRNDERRERRWFEERGEMRAQMKALQAQLETLQANREAKSEDAETDAPKLETFINSGKYKTYEEAQEAHLRAYLAFDRETSKKQDAAHTAQKTRETLKSDFETRIKEFQKTHPDFDDSFDAVRDVLEGPKGQATPLTGYLVRAKDGVQLIDYLGNHPELLKTLSTMPHDDAIAELGAIRREWKAAESKDPEKTDGPETSTRSPKAVRARGDVPNYLQAMNKAGDLKSFRDAKQAAQKAGSRF